MTEKEYRDNPAISQSDIKLFMKSPSLYHYYKVLGNKSKSTKELMFGSLVDNLIFDPNFKYVLVPKDLDRRTKEGKKKWEEILSQEDTGASIVDEWDFEKANLMIEKIKSHRIANYLLFGPLGENQKKIMFKIGAVQLKAMLDRIIVDKENKKITIVDYKTSSKESPELFRWSVKDFGYHIQNSFYVEAVKNEYSELFSDVFGDDYSIEFIFVVQYKEPPFQIYCVKLSESDVSFAEETWKKALNDINSRTITDQWEPEDYYSESGITEISVF